MQFVIKESIQMRLVENRTQYLILKLVSSHTSDMIQTGGLRKLLHVVGQAEHSCTEQMLTINISSSVLMGMPIPRNWRPLTCAPCNA